MSTNKTIGKLKNTINEYENFTQKIYHEKPFKKAIQKFKKIKQDKKQK
jgi:hypothetical protein